MYIATEIFLAPIWRGMPMSLITQDIEIIRQVRRLCLQQRFEEALDEAWKIEDAETRQTLLAICNSFVRSKFRDKVA
jgi:hypothetical protein